MRASAMDVGELAEWRAPTVAFIESLQKFHVGNLRGAAHVSAF
jgi:hypothetical protein